VNDEHRRTFIAGADEGFAGREDWPAVALASWRKFVGRERREDIDRGQSIGDLIFDRYRTRRHGALEIKRARGEGER
jgi:hypothetical protein